MRNGWTQFRSTIFIIALAAVFSLGCATTPKTSEQLVTLKSFPKDYEVVWAATLETVSQDTKIPLTIINKRSGILTSEWVHENRTIQIKDSREQQTYPSRYRINISLRRKPNFQADHRQRPEDVTVTVNKQFELKYGSEWRAFPSDKRLEANLLSSIDQRLNPLQTGK